MTTNRWVRRGAAMALWALIAAVFPTFQSAFAYDRHSTVAAEGGATFGRAATADYRATFLAANPELEGQVVVRHAVEQQVLTRYPGVVSEAEMHSLENLRGIPNELNTSLHLSQIRIEWNRFYRPFEASGTMPSQAQLLQKAAEIDAKYGSQFLPPR